MQVVASSSPQLAQNGSLALPPKRRARPRHEENHFAPPCAIPNRSATDKARSLDVSSAMVRGLSAAVKDFRKIAPLLMTERLVSSALLRIVAWQDKCQGTSFTRAVQALKIQGFSPENKKVISYHFAPLAQMNQLPVAQNHRLLISKRSERSLLPN
jgi:hypothetical protein